MITKIKDFENEDGSVDWAAHDKAEVANGERCMTCGCYIIPFRNPGVPRECISCNNITSSNDEVTHDSRIRCPRCGKITNVIDLEDNAIYEEGEFSLDCEECEKEFTVQVDVSYSYRSPERIKGEDDNVEGIEGKGKGNN